MDKRCLNCRWWNIPEAIAYYDMWNPTDCDTFDPMLGIVEIRKCTSPMLLFHERPVTSKQASVYDGSDYFGILVTGKDFHCSSWVGK